MMDEGCGGAYEKPRSSRGNCSRSVPPFLKIPFRSDLHLTNRLMRRAYSCANGTKGERWQTVRHTKLEAL